MTPERDMLEDVHNKEHNKNTNEHREKEISKERECSKEFSEAKNVDECRDTNVSDSDKAGDTEKEKQTISACEGNGEVEHENKEADDRDGEEKQEDEKIKKLIFQLRDDLMKERNLKEAYADKLKKLQGEFDNYRRRTKEEKEDITSSANKELISRLLPVLDNFERALESAENKKDFDTLINGIKMVYNQFKGVLKNEGLSPVEAEGEPFDPERHEACVIESSQEHEDNMVLEEWEKGYEYKGKIIRPSKVKVCKNN